MIYEGAVRLFRSPKPAWDRESIVTNVAPSVPSFRCTRIELADERFRLKPSDGNGLRTSFQDWHAECM